MNNVLDIFSLILWEVQNVMVTIQGDLPVIW